VTGVTDNLDLGRPDQIELIFSGRPGARRGRKPAAPQTFKTKVVTRGVDVTIKRVLQTLPPQAVPQRRPGTAHRDRRQLTR